MRSRDLLAYYRQVSQQLLTVVDVETTGGKPAWNRVIEVSVLQASLAKGIQEQQTHLINPEVTVPENITRFTGISQAMVNQAPFARDVWHRYLPLVSTGVLTAHNLEFDYGFLQAEFDRVNTVFSRPEDKQLCTVILSRLMLPDLPSRRLPDLVKHFRFPVGRSHRAEADTLACWYLAERLLTEVQNEADEVLLARFARQWLTLDSAATLLGCLKDEARSRLDAAGCKCRLVGRSKIVMYQRGEVEQV